MFEVYLLRFATAAHNVGHFQLECNFDEAVFSERMKVGLYNSKRNLRKREQKLSVTANSNLKPAADTPGEVAKAETAGEAGQSRADNVPAPTEPGNDCQDSIAAEVVAHCLEAATKGGKSFSCNVRLIRSAVFRRDPQGKNGPLQNELKSLLNGVGNNDVAETQEALTILQEEADLGVNM